MKRFFSKDTNSANYDVFSELYPVLNSYVLTEGDKEQSRNGVTMEILNFKTQVNPLYRCVGGYRRNINVYFLLAEALWIWAGRKDVKFLKIFNEKMAEYSDDGVNFHAPYGFRLRRWGLNSFDKAYKEGAQHSLGQSTDQVEEAIKMLHSSPEDRRVVLQIWNPDLDLNKKSKDLPCNDTLMFKVRKKKLHATIANRSNDLHLGLPTNIFQFSFIGEFISSILEVEYASQTHNSQSLHIYPEMNDIAYKMQNLYVDEGWRSQLYDKCFPEKLYFNWCSSDPIKRLNQLDYWVNQIIEALSGYDEFDKPAKFSYGDLEDFSSSLAHIYSLLRLYVGYKKDLKIDGIDKNMVRNRCIGVIADMRNVHTDFNLLAQNFFFSRMGGQDNILGTL